jgi:hypothetical protein
LSLHSPLGQRRLPSSLLPSQSAHAPPATPPLLRAAILGRCKRRTTAAVFTSSSRLAASRPRSKAASAAARLAVDDADTPSVAATPADNDDKAGAGGCGP